MRGSARGREVCQTWVQPCNPTAPAAPAADPTRAELGWKSVGMQQERSAGSPGWGVRSIFGSESTGVTPCSCRGRADSGE